MISNKTFFQLIIILTELLLLEIAFKKLTEFKHIS